MSDLNRGIMKFDGADKPILVAVSALLIFGGITALIIWALKSAYVVQLSVFSTVTGEINTAKLAYFYFYLQTCKILCYDI